MKVASEDLTLCTARRDRECGSDMGYSYKKSFEKSYKLFTKCLSKEGNLQNVMNFCHMRVHCYAQSNRDSVAEM